MVDSPPGAALAGWFSIPCRSLALLISLTMFCVGCAPETFQSGQTDVQALNGSNPAQQLLAARRISEAHWVPPDAVQPLFKLFKSDDAKLRRAAADALACLDKKDGKALIPDLIAAQKVEKDNGVRAVIEQSIERFSTPD